MKRILKITAITLAILIVIVIAIPFFVNVNSFRPKIETELSTVLGRQVTVGDLSLSILSGSVVASDIAIADDPAFSKSPFVAAKSLKVGVELMPLIFSKQLNITEITLEEPQISLLKTAAGKWNFSSLGGAAKNQPEAKSGGSSPANFSVAKLNVKDGRLSIGKAGSSAKPQAYDKVNIEVTKFSFTSQFPFQLSVQLPGGGDANITGKAGPISAEDASKTPFEASVKVNDLDIAKSGFIDPASGLAGLAAFDGTLSSNGDQARGYRYIHRHKIEAFSKGHAGFYGSGYQAHRYRGSEPPVGNALPGRCHDRQGRRASDGNFSDTR